jgi:hypothetical protein
MFVPQFIRLAPLQREELILQVEVDLPDHAEIELGGGRRAASNRE